MTHSTRAQGHGERSRTMKDTAAIIVAGGKGLRFGGKVRKQYLLLKRRPILWWSLAAFEKSPSVGSITVVVPADDVTKVSIQTRKWKLKKLINVIAGGSTRAESVRAGLMNLSSPRKRGSMDSRFRGNDNGMRYVAVHDGVRPLVTPPLIEKVIEAARTHKAALAASVSKDTIKIADARGYVHSSPSRDRMWLAQTPQIFERRLLERAHQIGRHVPVTDDAQLVERLGVRVKLVESSPENLKVTLPVDFVLARHILECRGGRLTARR